MILHVEFSENSLFEGCSTQSSIDFSSIRANAPDAADVIYADFVLSQDFYPAWRNALSIEVSLFNARHADLVGSHSNETEMLCWDIRTEQDIRHPKSVGELIFTYLQYRLLAWWYTGRSDTLQVYYSLRADSVNQSINNLSGAMLMDRKLRHF